MPADSYFTIKTISEGLYKDKGSKFLSFAYPIHSEDQAKIIIKETKKKYYDARHHCFAYRLGPGDDNYRVNDDGEPSGTAGKPILAQIKSNDLSDVLIVVVRYFGGVLLGTSGLINAYKKSASDAITNAQKVEKIIKEQIDISFPYELLSSVMHLIKEENIELLKQQLTDKCLISILVRQSEFKRIKDKLSNLYGLEILV